MVDNSGLLVFIYQNYLCMMEGRPSTRPIDMFFFFCFFCFFVFSTIVTKTQTVSVANDFYLYLILSILA